MSQLRTQMWLNRNLPDLQQSTHARPYPGDRPLCTAVWSLYSAPRSVSDTSLLQTGAFVDTALWYVVMLAIQWQSGGKNKAHAAPHTTRP